MEPLRLKAIDWFNISGRGKVATLNMGQIPKDRTIRLGDDVYIDDVLYIVNGIERFMIAFPREDNSKEPIGLLVREKQ